MRVGLVNCYKKIQAKFKKDNSSKHFIYDQADLFRKIKSQFCINIWHINKNRIFFPVKKK